MIDDTFRKRPAQKTFDDSAPPPKPKRHQSDSSTKVESCSSSPSGPVNPEDNSSNRNGFALVNPNPQHPVLTASAVGASSLSPAFYHHLLHAPVPNHAGPNQTMHAFQPPPQHSAP